MHACLRITEILDLIIGFMVDHIHEPDKICSIRHQDVVRLARTCKAFKDPALDVLWRTQSSLSPLILCLPDHLWTTKGDWVVSLREEPSHEDWLSLQRYSHRIRAFNYCLRRPRPVCTITLDAVFSPNLSQKLFPSLRTLDLEVIGYGSMFPFPPVLSSISLPQLVRLTLAISHTGFFKHPSIHFKPACAPSLQALTINVRCHRFDPVVVNFGDFPRLRSLHLLHLPFHGWWELIHLQYLCDLTVTLPDGFNIDVHSSMQPILPSLQRLSVSVCTFNQVTSLLLSITSSDLSSVTVSCRSYPTQSDIHVLFRAIERVNERSPNFGMLEAQCSFPIKSLLIPPANLGDPSYDLPRSTLALLLACHHLRVLKLDVLGELGIDDAFIARITLAWPDIEVLHLFGSSQCIPRVSLGGIHQLLQRCQRLRLLSIQIDARTVPEGEPKMRSLSLEKLDICGSRMTETWAVERYLRILAPRLEWLKL
ncbi:hypothetical protein PISMIDRAFT_681317 [Pisolithus microcarpus 441]|uniref:F-box domain-containing protein n=1 Tax=Pisolithus microcarpus 441 TaxID=765257 RepID=A0A0C9ZG23_9AGAM|nr:hypothetical protein PISMIDRAFT_681317 [Pisolithus microcarpus 441]